MSQAGLDFIKGYEKWNGRLDKNTGLWFPKDDGFGNLTIGWGHNCGTCEDFAGGITKAQGDILLAHDLRFFEGSVSKVVGEKPDQQQFDALVSFAFNVKHWHNSTLMKNAASGAPVTKGNFTDYGNVSQKRHIDTCAFCLETKRG